MYEPGVRIKYVEKFCEYFCMLTDKQREEELIFFLKLISLDEFALV